METADSRIPRVLSIAGSDSGGGAGIQADLKVFFALGCHGTTAVTALTAQNTVGVKGVHAVAASFVVEQIDAVASDFGVDAAKTGMLATAETVRAVAAAAQAHTITKLVVDPVAVSKHGHRLMADDALEAYRSDLFRLASVITPNLHEAGALLGREVRTLDEAESAARDLADFGSYAVLVKGGHLVDRPDDAIDVLFVDGELIQIAAPRFDTEDTHGTGCALSAAITAHLAQGEALVDAVHHAKEFITGAIEHGLRVGRGYGPVNPGWRLDVSG